MPDPQLRRPEDYAATAEHILNIAPADREALMAAKVYAELANAAAAREAALSTMHLVKVVNEAATTLALALQALSNQQSVALENINRTIKKVGGRPDLNR